MPRILIVEDCEPDKVLIQHLLRKRADWNLIAVHSAENALQILETVPVDLVISDIRLPGEDGLSMLAETREKHPRLPVIMTTGNGDEELVMQVLENGAAAYLPKASLVTSLVSTVERVLSVSMRKQNRRKLLESLESSRSRFVLNNNPGMIPTIINRIQSSLEMYNICNANEVMRIGIALEEALANAMYHGNLGVSSELKELPGNAFEEEAKARMQQAPYRDRKVYIDEIMSHTEARFVIRDEGVGFDPATLPDPTDLEWLSKPHGRGVMMMRSFVDQVVYNDSGNEVTLVKYAVTAQPLVPDSREQQTDSQEAELLDTTAE